MRIDFHALYQRSLLGGIGGLVGWLLIALLLPAAGEGFEKYLMAAAKGALIGLSLGALCGAWDGLFRSRSHIRLLSGAFIGAGMGLVGGVIGVPLGEALFETWKNLYTQSAGWALFGALIGANEGVAKRMRQKTLFGVYGGLLGGLLGGSTYVFLSESFQVVGFSRATAGTLGAACGLVLLGLFIGLMIALVEDLLRGAWLLFTSGRFEGQTRTLDSSKEVTTIGRSELADICILGDAQVAAEHAHIIAESGAFVLEAVDGAVLVSPGGNGEFSPVTRHKLANGDVIQIGGQRARFQSGKATPA